MRLTPVGVESADHDVEAPVAALLFRFYQSEGLHVEQLVFYPANLLFAQAAALQVKGEPRQVRRSGFAFIRRGVAIVASQFLLHLHGTHGRVQLNLRMEPVVIGLAEVIYEIERPWTAIAPRGIE